MAKHYWLVKQEPSDYSWSNFEKDGMTAWTGVRNFHARNNLRAMKPGDLVLFYHSGDEKQVVGVARVSKSAYPDPTAKEGDWFAVDLAPDRSLPQPVSLAAIKADPALADMPLVKRSRLSVMPITEAHFHRVLQVAGA
jgi:predicted RNA-binding protein with PUA-like domain